MRENAEKLYAGKKGAKKAAAAPAAATPAEPAPAPAEAPAVNEPDIDIMVEDE